MSLAVFSELERFSAFDISSTLNARWLKVKEVKNQERVDTLRGTLDSGESEAIVLADELRANLLIIDESKGRQVASSLGIEITRLLGVLLRAKNANLLPELRPCLDMLESQANFYLSQSVRSHVLTLANE